MADKFTTQVLDENQYDAWNALVTDSPTGSIYARPEYLDALCSATGGRFELMGVFRKGALVGGIPLYWEEGRAGRVATNRLLLYYNGLVTGKSESRSPAKQQSLMIGIQSAASPGLKSKSLDSLTIHSRNLGDSRVFRADGWHVRPHYSLVVELHDLDHCWDRIDHNLQRLIRRSESKGIKITCDEDFDEFYRQHESLCQRKSLPLYLPKQNFRNYYERLAKLGYCRIFHARLEDGKSIASLFILACKHPTTHTVVAASDDEFHDAGASAQIRWESFKHLCEAGYKENDLTDASLNSVTRFKSQLGGRLQQNLVLTLEPSRRYRTMQTITRLKAKLLGG